MNTEAVYYDKLEAARRAANPQPENVEEFDEEEVFEFEQSDRPDRRLSLSPLDRQTSQIHTQIGRASCRERV